MQVQGIGDAAVVVGAAGVCSVLVQRACRETARLPTVRIAEPFLPFRRYAREDARRPAGGASAGFHGRVWQSGGSAARVRVGGSYGSVASRYGKIWWRDKRKAAGGR